MAESPMIRVTCSGCRRALTVKAQHAGKRVRCPGCNALIDIPAPQKPAAAPPASQSVDDWELQPVGQTAGEAPAPTGLSKLCPMCKQDVAGTAKVCVNCGYSFTTGKRMSGLVEHPPSILRKIGAEAPKWIALAVVVGVIGYFVHDSLYGKKRLAGLLGFGEDEQSDPDNQRQVSRTPAEKEKELPNSCIVVEQSRFDSLTATWKKIEKARKDKKATAFSEVQTVPRGEKRVLIVPKGPGRLVFSAASQASPRGADAFSRRYSEGIEFDVDGSRGLQAIIEPPMSVLKGGQTLAGLDISKIQVNEAKNTAEIDSLAVGGYVLTGVQGSKLVLSYQREGLAVKLCWIDQECRIEKDGKVVCDPEQAPVRMFLTDLAWDGDKPSWSQREELKGLRPEPPRPETK